MKKLQGLLLVTALFFTLSGPIMAETTTCHPHEDPFYTGSTDGVDKTSASTIVTHGDEDGWAKFDISAVPNTHRILSVELHFYVSDLHFISNWYYFFTPVTVDPQTADPAILHQDITAEAFGAFYHSETNLSLDENAWNTRSFGGEACLHLADCLQQDWFAIGLASNWDRMDEFMSLHGWLQPNTLYLVVEHDDSTPRTWFVDDDAPGDPGPGTPDTSDPLEDGSAAHPFDAIDEAVAAAATLDTVLVADGLYTGVGNRDIDFRGKAITVRSVNGPQDCVIDSQDMGRGFTFFSNEGSHTKLDGFTILNGRVPDDMFFWLGGGGISAYSSYPTLDNLIIEDCRSVIADGAGISCGLSTPTITGCLIRNNTGRNGGGIYCSYKSAPVISGCTITGNHATFNGGGICGGNRSNFTVTDCTITDNDAQNGGGIDGYNHRGEISNCNITNNRATSNGGGIRGYVSSPTIRGCTISGNLADRGAGINLSDYNASPDQVTRILDNEISDNHADGMGGGIRSTQGYLEIRGNTIKDNSAVNGGGIGISGGWGTIADNVILNNVVTMDGGGIHCQYDQQLLMINNLLAGNNAVQEGGALHCATGSDVLVASCTLTGNTALGTGGGGISSLDATLNVSNSILWNDSPDEILTISGVDPSVNFSDVQGGHTGQGNIDNDPLFATGPLGPFYLSQVAAGQAVDSPGLDAGNPASVMIEGTTRTDAVQDQGVIDMGYHYPLFAAPLALAIGPGPASVNPPQVRLFHAVQDAVPTIEFSAYGANQFGVNVTAGDVTGSGSDKVLTGAGPGEMYGPHVRGFYSDGTPLPGLSFLAYGTNKYGVNIAAGDLDGDGYDEIITGAGPGAVFGPHVRGWDYDGSGAVSAMAGVSYFAYGTPKWGVNVSAGDIDGDGFDEIVTGPGPGAVYGPHVRGWNVDGGAVAAIPGVSFFAYGTNKFGVNVTCGDVDGDGIDEIVTGPGPGAVFGTHIRGWNYDGQALTELPGLNFFAWAHALASYGAEVYAGADLNDDGRDEIVVGCGPDPDVGTPVKVYLYDGEQVIQWFSLEAFEGLTHGTTVAAGRF